MSPGHVKAQEAQASREKKIVAFAMGPPLVTKVSSVFAASQGMRAEKSDPVTVR